VIIARLEKNRGLVWNYKLKKSGELIRFLSRDFLYKKFKDILRNGQETFSKIKTLNVCLVYNPTKQPRVETSMGKPISLEFCDFIRTRR